ncbi:MAG: sulfotransferase domain-containing protein [Phycisphaerae bacterium]
MRIILTEFPKSGGTWVTTMLGDAQCLPRRDLYTNDDWVRFNIFVHPWYEHALSTRFPAECVIKSHELPDSSLIAGSDKKLHLVRDGRDAVVSWWHHESDLELSNGFRERFDENFDDFVRQRAARWSTYVRAWRETRVPELRYEAFLADPLGQLRDALLALDLPIDQIRLRMAVAANSRQRVHRSFERILPRRNVFVRKAVVGDWRTHFSPRNIVDFKRVAGDALIELGYERNEDW